MEQDPEESLIYQNNREVFYSFDNEKGFTQKVDFQSRANQTIIRQGWEAAGERMAEIRGEVLSGRISPIAYYMEKNLMEVRMLAGYMGLSRWKVRRHLKPGVFSRLSGDLIQRYAEVFNISPGQLVTPDFSDDDTHQHRKHTDDQTRF